MCPNGAGARELHPPGLGEYVSSSFILFVDVYRCSAKFIANRSNEERRAAKDPGAEVLGVKGPGAKELMHER